MSQRRSGVSADDLPFSEALGSNNNNKNNRLKNHIHEMTTGQTLDGADDDEQMIKSNNNNNDDKFIDEEEGTKLVNSSQSTSTSLSIDERYNKERNANKMKNWKESPFCVGLTEVTWADELHYNNPCINYNKHGYDDYDDDDDYNNSRRGGRGGDNGDCHPCNYFSAIVCSRLGAGRVGNMAILRQSTEWVEEEIYVDDDEDDDDDDDDEEDGNNDEEEGVGSSSSSSNSTDNDKNNNDEKTNLNNNNNNNSSNGTNKNKKKKLKIKKHRYTRPKLNCIVGPFWPMLIFVTYPLILGVSLWTLVSAILVPNKNPFIVIIWFVCTIGLIGCLTGVSCTDPGILPKYNKPPPSKYERSWRWNDQTQSYRPRGAFYDTDCAVIVEEFDHTCPWTGTAIGKKNMPYFQGFVSLVFICLIFDILLLSGAI